METFWVPAEFESTVGKKFVFILDLEYIYTKNNNKLKIFSDVCS